MKVVDFEGLFFIDDVLFLLWSSISNLKAEFCFLSNSTKSRIFILEEDELFDTKFASEQVSVFEDEMLLDL